VVVGWDATTRAAADLTFPDLDVGSWAHAYGGGAHVEGEDCCYVVRGVDSQIVRVGPDGDRVVTVSDGAGTAYGDLRLTSGGALLAVRESAGADAGDAIVSIANDRETVLVRDDFLAAATHGPAGQLAWLRWSATQMPWDSTALFVASLSPNGLDSPTRIAGGPDESLVEPTWGPAGALYFVSDRSGWWNLYCWDGMDVEPVAPMDAECAAAPWELGHRSYVHLGDGRIAILRQTGARIDLVIRDRGGEVTPVPLPYTSYKPCLATCSGRVAAIAASVREAPQVVLINPDPPYDVEVLARGPSLPGVSVTSPTPLRLTVDGGRRLDGLLYLPEQARDGARVPVIVRPHPGPTDNMRERLSWWTQYFTGQGFAVAELGYRGSTGYGRVFRQSLYGHWGHHDVEDVVALAHRLISLGHARPDSIFVSGQSAGGYTALQAISRRDTPFAGSVASMAITDPGLWRETAPRFQRAHAARLVVGAAPADASMIQRPVLLLHGSRDAVAPIGATLTLAEGLRSLAKRVELLVLDGEGHAYCAPDKVAAALEAEALFHRRLLVDASGIPQAVRDPA
jgi:dipeptidyl aminopeptidase/acylaminoacyl peptidase